MIVVQKPIGMSSEQKHNISSVRFFFSFTLWMTCKMPLIHAQSTLWNAPQNLQFTLWNSAYGMSDHLVVTNSRCSIPCNPSILKGYLSEFHLWFLPLVVWIDGFLDWIFRERIFKILQSYSLKVMNVKWTNIVFVLRYGDETLHLWKPLLNTNDQRGSSQCLTQRNTIFVHFTFMFS